MTPLPTGDVRTNLGSWAVSTYQLPAVANKLHDWLKNEPYDPNFLGQGITTTYFDTRKGKLRQTRVSKDKYLTLRVRCYQAPELPEAYALSAKTESEKFRMEITGEDALAFQKGQARWGDFLPGNLYARLLDISQEEEILPKIQVTCKRFAVEDNVRRFTLDVDVRTDLGKVLPFSVLEYKGAPTDTTPPNFPALGLRPIKLSKFVWSTRI
jgi:hypothetical protein